METGVTKPIEEAINTIDGHRRAAQHHAGRASRRSSSASSSRRRARSRRRTCATRSASVLSQLPDGTDPPIIDKFDVDAAPVMSDRRLRPPQPARGDRDRAQADQGGHRDAARRRPGDPDRRPGARDQHLRRPRPADGARRSSIGQVRDGAPRAEHRAAGRPRRPDAARARPPHDGPHRARCATSTT